MKSNQIPIEIKCARDLRKKQTPAEKKMWGLLRNRRFMNKKFLRQHVVRVSKNISNPQFFVADFYCAEHKLIVELDGEIHNTTIPYDKDRDDILRQLGYRVCRFSNDLVANSPIKILETLEFLFNSEESSKQNIRTLTTPPEGWHEDC